MDGEVNQMLFDVCARLSLDELYTTLTEVESILNSRPLSYASSNDLEEPLMPSLLLMARRVLSMPDHLGVTVDPDDEDFTSNPTSTLGGTNQIGERLIITVTYRIGHMMRL